MAKSDHGLTCGDSPIDHNCAYSRCEDAESDQGVSWSMWVTTLNERLHFVTTMHVKLVSESGMTDGTCAECGHLWPCQTAHIVKGYGYGDGVGGKFPSDCFVTGWCYHEQRKVTVLYPGDLPDETCEERKLSDETRPHPQGERTGVPPVYEGSVGKASPASPVLSDTSYEERKQEIDDDIQEAGAHDDS